jgi:DNA-directed RNA polymerase specialized sigma24 family protein
LSGRIEVTKIIVRTSDDSALFDEVFLPHLQEAYRLARWLTGNASDAEDVVQEAAMRAFRAIGMATAEEVRKALASLPALFREIVVLREMNELSYREIASVTNLPIGTVMSRLSRARQLLIGALGQVRP